MPKQVKVLRVVAKREGFRRAGMEFGAVPKNLPLDELSDHAHKAIKEDPALVTFETVMHQHEDGTLVDMPQPDVGALDKREAHLAHLKAELESVAARLDERTTALRVREVELDERQRELDERAAELQVREAAVAQAEKAKAAAGDKPKTGSK